MHLVGALSLSGMRSFSALHCDVWRSGCDGSYRRISVTFLSASPCAAPWGCSCPKIAMGSGWPLIVGENGLLGIPSTQDST